jgi:DNA polymerase (family 10)
VAVSKLENKLSWLEAGCIAVGIANRLKGLQKYKICGSIRRRKEEVGDIDIVAILSDREALEKSIEDIAGRILAKGERKYRFVTQEIQIDLVVADEESYEPSILYLTGSKWFNVRCRARAKKLGYLLNEYGLWDKDGNLVENNEISILSILGMEKYTNPEMRR